MLKKIIREKGGSKKGFFKRFLNTLYIFVDGKLTIGMIADL
jgi:hypothetical protein